MTTQMPYAVVYESELRYVASLAADREHEETGGELFGLLSHGGRPVIMLATGPGLKAIHTPTHFQQDIDFLRRSSTVLREYCALQFVGTHHSHHRLGLQTLSAGDENSMHHFSEKNGIKRCCQMLATLGHRNFHANPTHDLELDRAEKSSWWARKISRTRHDFGKLPFGFSGDVNVYAFFYHDAAYDKPVECPIKVIPGMSPFRHAIRYQDKMRELHAYKAYPLSRIKINQLGSGPRVSSGQNETAKSAMEHDIPPVIFDQLRILPYQFREEVHVALEDGLIVVSLRIYGHLLLVGLQPTAAKSYAIVRVLLTGRSVGQKPIDITAQAITGGNNLNIYAVCLLAARVISRQGEYK